MHRTRTTVRNWDRTIRGRVRIQAQTIYYQNGKKIKTNTWLTLMNYISLISSKTNTTKKAAQKENSDSFLYLLKLFHDSKIAHLRTSFRLLIRICHQSIWKNKLFWNNFTWLLVLVLIRDIMGYARRSLTMFCATKENLLRSNLSPNSNSNSNYKIELELERSGSRHA
jgi:uncharacterized membrane protein